LNAAIGLRLIVTAAIVGFLGSAFSVNTDSSVIFPEILGAAFDCHNADLVLVDRSAEIEGLGRSWQECEPEKARNQKSNEMTRHNHIRRRIPLVYDAIGVIYANQKMNLNSYELGGLFSSGQVL
jgi:hypothetical protein